MIAGLRRPLCQGLTAGWLYKYTYDAENRLIERMLHPVAKHGVGDGFNE
jgi:hypothetical protein